MGARKRDGFYKRGGSPFWWTRDPRDGHRKSTKCRDLEAAKRTRTVWERMAADPAHAAAEQATLGEWCGRFVAWKEKCSSAATVSVARQKLGHWVRLVGASCALSMLSEPKAFDDYLSSRRAEHASDHTISKEVAHMLAVLKLAKRAKCFAGDLSVLRPPDLHAGYKPRERNLTRAELAALLSELEPHRGALVAVGVALGVRLGEAQRLLPTDIDWANDRVFIRGTKTAESKRYVPILSLFRPLLEAALPYLPLAPWGKVWRDIQAACKRARIAPCSTNDLRRTHATLLAEAGVDADVTRRLLGHTTRNLVDRVYGQPSTEALAVLAEGKLLGAAPLLQDFVGASINPTEPPSRGVCATVTVNDTAPGVDSPDRLSGHRCEVDQHPRNVAGDTSCETARTCGSNSEDVTAGRDPLNSYIDVTVEVFPERKELETSIITGAPGPIRTADLRLRKGKVVDELDAGILGFRGDSLRWIPPDSAGFGWELRGFCTGATQ